MRGPIKRTPLERVEDRSEARLPSAWIGGGSPRPAEVDGTWLMRGALAVRPTEEESVVLVMLGADGAEARAALLAHAAAGARVYVLAGPEFGKGQADGQVLQESGVLVRRVPEVPATCVHSARLAYLWLGGGFVLRLDDPQAEALRQIFLRHFWHEATEEACGARVAWRPARERPFDVPEVPASSSLRWDGPDTGFLGSARGALMHIARGLPPEEAPRRLWFPAGSKHHNRLSRLAKAGVDVVWEERGLPDLLVTEGTGEVLLPGASGRLRVRLREAQAGALGRLLEASGAWRFQVDARLGDRGHREAKFWLPGEAAARGLEAEQLVDVPAVAAKSLRGVPETTPASVPVPRPLALSVRYTWMVVPPRLPRGTEEDALIGRWRALDKDWTTRLASVRAALEAAEEEHGRIRRALARLAREMLGFERTRSGLLAEVAKLEAQALSTAGPDGAPQLLLQLRALEERAGVLQADVAEAERRGREDEAREKQETEWKARVTAAKSDLRDRQQALAEAQARRGPIEEALKTTEDALKSADKKDKKDLNARRRKLSDDIQRVKKDVTRLEGEIAALEQRIAETFEFRPPAPRGRRSQPGRRFVPPASKERPPAQVPDEALPEVGALRSHKGARYLVIHAWEELAAGEKTAARLSAKLVAPEDV